MGEVLSVDRLGDTMDVWFYLQDNKKGGAYDWYQPMSKGGYTPEYVNHLGQTVLSPKGSEVQHLARRDDTKMLSGIVLVVPSFELQTGGKLTASSLREIDTYLRSVSASDRKAVLELNDPTEAEKKVQEAKDRTAQEIQKV